MHLEQYSVASKQLQCLHGLKAQSDHRVVIVDSVVNDEPVWAFLTLQDRCAEVFPVPACLPAASEQNKVRECLARCTCSNVGDQSR